jgi:hypothetical protein
VTPDRQGVSDIASRVIGGNFGEYDTANIRSARKATDNQVGLHMIDREVRNWAANNAVERFCGIVAVHMIHIDIAMHHVSFVPVTIDTGIKRCSLSYGNLFCCCRRAVN